MAEPKFLYFFYNGDLHKKIFVQRATDVITAWNYPKEKLEKYTYTDVKKNGERAFSTAEVGKMLNRKHRVINNAMSEGKIPKPQFIYGLNGEHKIYKHMWSEKDIMKLHEYYTTIHIGRPRKDGRINTRDLPTAREVRAMINQGTVFYVKDKDGNFVPTWDADRL